MPVSYIHIYISVFISGHLTLDTLYDNIVVCFVRNRATLARLDNAQHLTYLALVSVGSSVPP